MMKSAVPLSAKRRQPVCGLVNADVENSSKVDVDVENSQKSGQKVVDVYHTAVLPVDAHTAVFITPKDYL